MRQRDFWSFADIVPTAQLFIWVGAEAQKITALVKEESIAVLDKGGIMPTHREGKKTP